MGTAYPSRVAEVSLGKTTGTLRPGADTPIGCYTAQRLSPQGGPCPGFGSKLEGAGTSETVCSGISQRLRIPPCLLLLLSMSEWDLVGRGVCGGGVTSNGFLQCPKAAARAG